MATIVPFTGARVRTVVVRDGFNARAESPAAERPAHGGYPSVDTTAAVDVVRALQFYAAGGEDRGDTARRALRGMSSVLAANDGGLA
jgi:hypothetical protein